MFRSPILHPPNERSLVHAGLVTFIITHVIIGTIPSREEVTETTKESTEAVEEATSESADLAVAWVRGASSWQDGQDWW